MDKNKLLVNGLGKILSAVISLSVLLFIPAGTIHFLGAWRMIIILVVPMFVLGTYLLIKNPELLAKRLKAKEEENDQKVVILISAIVFIVCFILCGLDYRFKWTNVPTIIIIIACIIFLLTYVLFCELLKENEFLSRTVEVQEGQHVVSTGLYGIVRHPMYSIIFFMFISIPLLIGSFVGLIPLILIPYILVKRIIMKKKS